MPLRIVHLNKFGWGFEQEPQQVEAFAFGVSFLGVEVGVQVEAFGQFADVAEAGMEDCGLGSFITFSSPTSTASWTSNFGKVGLVLVAKGRMLGSRDGWQTRLPGSRRYG